MAKKPMKGSHRVRRPTPPGQAPGTLEAQPASKPSRLRVMAYGPEDFLEQDLQKADDVLPLLERYPVVWLNVDGLGDISLIQRVGEIFHLHPLALEDVINLHQRAKVEHYEGHEFIVAHMVECEQNKLSIEQLSIFLGNRFVLTFQDDIEGDCLNPVRNRIRYATGAFRQHGPDHLVYALLDAVIDHYFPILEYYGEALNAVEFEILDRPMPHVVAQIHDIKRDLIHLRRAIWPLRDALNIMIRDPLPLIQQETRIYLRDCYDHIVRIIDFIETYRELGADLVDLQYAKVGFRTNEVMRVLTVVTSIFIPLTFIVGIYGMNFDTRASGWNMPELNWPFGYPLIMAGMGLLSCVLLYLFYRIGWLSLPPGDEKP